MGSFFACPGFFFAVVTAFSFSAVAVSAAAFFTNETAIFCTF